MKQEIINKYTDEVLYNRLLKLNIKEKYVEKITNDIKEQMYAVLYHWNDVKFRNALLILGLEEGKFYMPDADLDIKCFVVVTIRNSLLETMFSDESNLMEIYEEIPEDNIIRITSEAITYFKDVDFMLLAKELQKEEIKDKYKNIADKYPMAWEALVQLGNCMGKKVAYEKVEVKNKIKIEDLSKGDAKISTSGGLLKDVQSGINENFSEQLISYLRNVIEDGQSKIFYADCFKMITRNFEKLLKTMEILLENDKIILTSNYYITNSYIGRRTELYKAAHSNADVEDKILDSEFLVGVARAHGDVLRQHREEMKRILGI